MSPYGHPMVTRWSHDGHTMNPHRTTGPSILILEEEGVFKNVLEGTGLVVIAVYYLILSNISVTVDNNIQNLNIVII